MRPIDLQFKRFFLLLCNNIVSKTPKLQSHYFVFYTEETNKQASHFKQFIYYVSSKRYHHFDNKLLFEFWFNFSLIIINFSKMFNFLWNLLFNPFGPILIWSVWVQSFVVYCCCCCSHNFNTGIQLKHVIAGTTVRLFNKWSKSVQKMCRNKNKYSQWFSTFDMSALHWNRQNPSSW